jgi:hypothetical protein
MKVVAGSHGNDAIGPRASVGGGVMGWPDEWGPRKAGSVHIDRDVSVSHGRLRAVEGTVRSASRMGTVA